MRRKVWQSNNMKRPLTRGGEKPIIAKAEKWKPVASLEKLLRKKGEKK